ncbi:MAG: hypothetical protein HY648_09680 [Acidobacteria bacterium]|nr:hypothetical protein [Acidobacteriota bacterium]
MKQTLFVIVLFAALATIPTASAQNHGEVGIFANYFRHSATGNTNLWGLGGRLSANVHENVQLEAEMAYDFNRTFTEGFKNPTTGTITSQRSNLRVLHGMFGPKFQTGGGPIRAFVTVKGGFINFRFDDRPATFGTFASTVDDLRLNNMSGVLYPGGGIEFYASIFGIRFDVGDEIYFLDGARNNLRVSFGPHIRF